MRPSLIATLLAVTLLGCAQSPAVKHRQLDVETPERWTMSAEVPIGDLSDSWWHSFDDRQLNSLVELAFENNYDLIAAASRVDQAVAQAVIAGAELKPSVGAGLNGNRSKQNFVGLPIPGAGGVLSTTSTRYQLSLDTSWEIDLWGRLRAGSRAALADAEAVREEWQAARLSLSGQVSKLWFAILEAREQLQLAEQTAASFTRSAELVRARYERGVRPSIELRLALSNQYSAEALVSLRETQLENGVRQLETLLGRYPSARLLDEHPPQPREAALLAIPLGLPADLISRRPDMRGLERRLAASDQRTFAARRARYPQISLTASGGSVSDQLEDLVDGDFSVWSLIGNIAAPLFQGGRLRANVTLNEAIGDELLAAYTGQALRAYAEVETALATEERLRLRAQQLEQTASQLSGAQRLAESRYASGVGDYLTVLESQTRALNAHSEWITTRRELRTNRVDLHLALGGRFPATADAKDSHK